MFRNLLKVGTLLLVLTFGLTATASAQHGHGGLSHGHIHNSHGHSGHGHIHRGHVHGGYINSYPTFHNTTHLDYHPGGFQQHGNHFHYVPRHYDVHRTGHYHW